MTEARLSPGQVSRISVPGNSAERCDELSGVRVKRRSGREGVDDDVHGRWRGSAGGDGGGHGRNFRARGDEVAEREAGTLSLQLPCLPHRRHRIHSTGNFGRYGLCGKVHTKLSDTTAQSTST